MVLQKMNNGLVCNLPIKSDSTVISDCSKSKSGDECEKITNSNQIYKTPNYKQKKRPDAKIMNKHTALNLEKHEAAMEQKYGVKLSTRKDVVCKTLLRSLKRYYTELFFETYELGKKESTESYLHKIQEFSQRILYSKLIDMREWNITLDQATKFIAIMVSPGHIKNSLTEKSDIDMHKDFYSCLYQYTHKKLANMLKNVFWDQTSQSFIKMGKNAVCGFLFHEFVKDGHLATFISKCSTMSQNSSVYEQMGDSFVKTILDNRFEVPEFY
jgi:hypothetical protein